MKDNHSCFTSSSSIAVILECSCDRIKNVFNVDGNWKWFFSQLRKPLSNASPFCSHHFLMDFCRSSSMWTCWTFPQTSDRGQLRQFEVSHSHATQYPEDFLAASSRLPLKEIHVGRWFALQFNNSSHESWNNNRFIHI